MIRDHVKARIEAVKAGCMPKITLEEYETLRMNTDEWRAIASILDSDALKHAIENTLKNCSNNYGTYDHALQTVYVPLLMERVFGLPVKEQSVETPKRTYSCEEMWDICQDNPNARFTGKHRKDSENRYLLKAGIHPKTKEFGIYNEFHRADHLFMDRRLNYSSYTITRLPDAPAAAERTYTTLEMWDICEANPNARFTAESPQIKTFRVQGGRDQRTNNFCLNTDSGRLFMNARVDYNIYTITRLPDQQDVPVNQIVSAKEAWDTCKANPKARFEALLYGKPNKELPYNVIGGLHPKTKQFCLLNDPLWSRGSDCFAAEIPINWTFRRLPNAP